MSRLESRTAQDARGDTSTAGGASRLRRRRRSSTCIAPGLLGVEHTGGGAENQLLSGKEMFQVIKRLSREKAVTMKLARMEIEKAFESGYVPPSAAAAAATATTPAPTKGSAGTSAPSRMASLRKAGQLSMKLPSRIRSPIASSGSRVAPRGEKQKESESGGGAVLHELVKRQESGAPLLRVTPPDEVTAATVTRQRSSSVDRLSTRIRSSDNNDALLEEVEQMANGKANTLFSNLTSKFKRKKKKSTLSSTIGAPNTGRGLQYTSASDLPPPNLPPPNLPPPNLPPPNLPPPNLPPPHHLPPPNLPLPEEMGRKEAGALQFPPPKFSPRATAVKRFPTPKFSPLRRQAPPNIGAPSAEVASAGEGYDVEELEDPDAELADYAVRARHSRRCSSIPRMERLSLADRLQSLSKKNLAEMHAVHVDEIARYANMPYCEFVSLVMMGLNSLASIARACLDGDDRSKELPPEVQISEDSKEEDDEFDGITDSFKRLVLRLYRFIRFILDSLLTESIVHLDCAKDILCILKDTVPADLSGAVEEAFFEAIRQERSAVTAVACNNIKEDAHETLLQLLTNGVYLCSLFSLRKSADGKRATKEEASYGMAALFAARSIIDLVGDLVDKIAAVTVFSAMRDLQKEKEANLAELGLTLETESINIYDEMIHDHTGTSLASDGSQGVLCRCHLPANAETVNSIVCTITDPSGEHTLEYVKMIITTHSAFTTNWKLFLKLRERFFAPESIDNSFAIGLRVGAVLKQWLKLCFSDFDAQLVYAVKHFLKEEMIVTHKEMAVHILQAMEGLCCETNWEVQPLQGLPVLNPKTLIENPFDISAPLLQYTSQQFADQLTLRDRDLYRKLDMKGLLGQAWTKPARQHESRSLGLLIARLNQCSSWVASVVLSPLTLAKRIKTMTRIIRVGDALRKMHNYMGVAYIIFGLSQASVSRLKFTLSGLSKSTKKTLAELQDLMDPTGSYKSYRAALANAPPPVLPFVGVKLSDLTMIDEGNPTFLPGEFEESPPLVNVQKQEMVYHVLSDLTMFKQSCEYDISVQEPLFSYCKVLPHLTDEDELYFLSRDREPPGSTASELK